MQIFRFFLLILFLGFQLCFAQNSRPRDLGITIGVLSPGTLNAITDVAGLKVGHITINDSKSVHTGVTAILPHDGNMYQEKVPAAIYIGNGYGKLNGYSQVEELGNIETPILLTNTLNVPGVAEAVMKYSLNQEGNESVRSVNPVVGETNDGGINDIRGMHVQESHVFDAIKKAKAGPVDEGSVGAGTGTICFGFKGGIGTASRKLPESLGGYTVGVLVQTNFGGVLEIDGVPIGVELGQYYFKDQIESHADGSCMIVVATDAPVTYRNLRRIAKRAMLGLANTGGIASNGSGDYVIAFSTHPGLRIANRSESPTLPNEELRNDRVSPLFLATIEATEEAIINSLFAATAIETEKGREVETLPVAKVLKIMKRYRRIQK